MEVADPYCLRFFEHGSAIQKPFVVIDRTT